MGGDDSQKLLALERMYSSPGRKPPAHCKINNLPQKVDRESCPRPTTQCLRSARSTPAYGQIFNDLLTLDRFVCGPSSMPSVPKRHSDFAVHRRQSARVWHPKSWVAREYAPPLGGVGSSVKEQRHGRK
jgi:hypothetical protein